MDPERPPHPGEITYVDGNTNEVVAVCKVDEVPEAGRFARTQDGAWVPVVRVVATTAEKQRFVAEYGPDGQLLRHTVQLAE